MDTMNKVARHSVIAATLALPIVGLPMGTTSALANGHASGNCSSPFTLEDQSSYLQIPTVAAGIAAGASTVDDDVAFFNLIDSNGNGLVCVKPSGSKAEAHIYYVNAVDDHSAA